MKIAFFVPCFVDLCRPQAAEAAVRVLERLGHEVRYDERVICCGQPAFNAGHWAESRRVAGRVLDLLAEEETVVILSGSCGAMIKVFYPELFAGTPREAEAVGLAGRTHEFSEFLVGKLGVTDLGARFDARVTVHDGCHGLRELRLKEAPRRLLERVRGLELVEMTEAESCCGFGGTFSAKFPMISTAMGEVKCESALETSAEYIVSNDASCLLHLDGLIGKRGLALKTLHLAEVLAKE